MANLDVLGLCGSLRTASFNGAALRLAGAALPASMTLQTFDWRELPLYDGDVEAQGMPPLAVALKERIARADAVLIATPEYNFSIPGGLKNLIDWTSRFRPQPFDGKHGLLLSASPSMAGGNRGLWALRVPFEHMGARIFPDMFSLAMAHKAFNEQGALADAALQGRFDRTLESFLSLVEAATHYPCMKRAWVEFLGEPVGAGLDRVDETTVS